MGRSELQALYNLHCRFKLRSGREVFGVIWEVNTSTERKLYFASVQEYKRVMAGGRPDRTNAIPLSPEDIMWGQMIAAS